MALDRKDARCYLDADVHAAMVELCNQRGTTIADFIEGIVAPEVSRLKHETIELYERFRRAGLIRNDPESSGGPRK